MSQSNESNNVFEILSLMAGFRFKNLNEFKIFDKLNEFHFIFQDLAQVPCDDCWLSNNF